MKKRLIITGLLLLTPVLFAQSGSGSAPADYALQFQLSSDLTITDFQGGTLSGWMKSGGKYDYRFGVEFATVSDKTENALDMTECETFIGLSFQLLHHTSWRTICLYYGFGPYISYASSKTSYDGTGAPDDVKSSAFNIGGVGVLGAEIFVRRDISFSAEYGIAAGYGSSKNDATDIKTSTLYLANRSVKLGMSVYFNK